MTDRTNVDALLRAALGDDYGTGVVDGKTSAAADPPKPRNAGHYDQSVSGVHPQYSNASGRGTTPAHNEISYGTTATVDPTNSLASQGEVVSGTRSHAGANNAISRFTAADGSALGPSASNGSALHTRSAGDGIAAEVVTTPTSQRDFVVPETPTLKTEIRSDLTKNSEPIVIIVAGATKRTVKPPEGIDQMAIRQATEILMMLGGQQKEVVIGRPVALGSDSGRHLVDAVQVVSSSGDQLLDPRDLDMSQSRGADLV